MRKLGMLLAVAMLAFGVSGTANAALLHYHGTLILELGTLPSIPAIGQGVATVNNSGALGHLGDMRLKASRGGHRQQGRVRPGDGRCGGSDRRDRDHGHPRAPARWARSRATRTRRSNPLTKQILPIAGLAKVCLFSTACGTALPLLLTQHTGATGTKGAGIGGILTIGGTSPIRISIEAAPWTLKTKTSIDQITTPVGGTVKKYVNRTEKGFAHGPSSNTTSTALPSGVVQAITPMQVVTNLTNGSNQKIALFGFLTIHFVPEPGMLLLLGSGVAGLVLLGRHRMRK